MKQRNLLLSFILCVLIGNKAIAQMVGDCVFLQGKYVEIGIAPNGGYGSTLPAPATYHPNLVSAITFWDPGAATYTTSSNLLGFVADYGRDGWTVGTPPYFGDYYLPGSPQEGWAVQVNGVESDAYIPSYSFTGTGYTGTLTGTNVGYSTSGGISRGIWQGAQGNLSMRQTTVLDTNKLYFTINVVMKNTGTTPLTGIYYMRTLDPDNEVTTSPGFGGYTTSNTIAYQLPNPGNKVLVSAVGTEPSFAVNAYLGLGTKDCRAKCFIISPSSLTPSNSLDALYDQTTTNLYTQGTNSVSDQGVGLVYNIGTLAAGDSTSLTYAYILNAAYIDSALDATQPAFLVNSLSFYSGDTIDLCNYNFDTVLVSLGSGTFYNWSWSPTTFLTDSTGTFNVIPADSISSTITYSITGVNVSGGCDTVHYNLTFVHDTFNIYLANMDTGICKGQSVQAVVTGLPVLNYTWTPATGVSNSTIMNPVLSPSVTTTYTVTANSSSGCLAVSKHFTITVAAPPPVFIDSNLVKTCVGVPVDLHSSITADPLSTYTYSWSPATGLSNPNIANPVVTPGAVGNVTYTITIVPNGIAACASDTTLRVHTIGDFTINSANANVCLGTSVTLSVTGSNEIAYVWTPTTGVVTSTSMAPVITPTAQGQYIYTVTGSYAHCPDYHHTYSIRVDTMAHPVTITDTICLGMTDSFDFTVPGGNATTNFYHYQWTPGFPDVLSDTMPRSVVAPSTVGVHTYIINVSPPAANCAVNNILTIRVLPNVITVSPDTAICKGGVVTNFGTGDPSFTYQWLPTTGVAVSTVLNTLLAPDTSVSYLVIASFYKCPDMYATINVDVQPNPSVYVGGNRLLCEFDTLHLHANVTPAWYTGYNYSWSPGVDLDDSTTQNVVFSGSTTTNLILTVSTSAGCTTKDSALITVFPGNFAAIGANSNFCPGDSLMVVPTPTGISYHWYPSMYVSDSLSGSPIIKPITTTTYTVVATTANGCTDTVNWTATVYPGALLYIPDSVLLYIGESYHIEPSTNCTSFLWFPTGGLDNPYISNPVASPDVSTLYIVQGTTENGCKASDSINVFRTEDAILAMPNAFTPGTGVNNMLKVIDEGISQLNYFRVYNRWGNVVFETKDISKGWDGTWKGEPQPFGVYVFDVQAVSLTGKIVNKTGNVTLLR